MSRESFKILKEINSLYSKESNFLDLISKENKRISFIEKNRADRLESKTQKEEKIKDTNSAFQKIENEIAELSKRIGRDKANLTLMTDDNSINSMKKQIAENEVKLNQAEEKGFLYMEETESLELSLQEDQEFLQGSLESLLEIEGEVSTKNKEYNLELEKIAHRILLLKEELPPPFKNRLEQVILRKIPFSSFSRIKSGACEFCRMSLSVVDINLIEDKLALKSCSGCSRIFIPIQASY